MLVVMPFMMVATCFKLRLIHFINQINTSKNQSEGEDHNGEADHKYLLVKSFYQEFGGKSKCLLTLRASEDALNRDELSNKESRP